MPILKDGETAPDFTVKAHDGSTVKLLPPVWPVSQLASHWTCT